VNTSLFAIKTNADLLNKLRSAPARVASANDLLEQRVSFVFGSLARDSGVTRERVRQVLLEQVGGTAVAHK
jgi:hypothetical protein